jgi:hypothetical protein
MTVIMYTPPQNQGQMIEVSYGWLEGDLYRRVRDTSELSVNWFVLRAKDGADTIAEDVWSDVPNVPDDAWTPCAGPRE